MSFMLEGLANKAPSRPDTSDRRPAIGSLARLFAILCVYLCWIEAPIALRSLVRTEIMGKIWERYRSSATEAPATEPPTRQKASCRTSRAARVARLVVPPTHQLGQITLGAQFGQILCVPTATLGSDTVGTVRWNLLPMPQDSSDEYGEPTCSITRQLLGGCSSLAANNNEEET